MRLSRFNRFAATVLLAAFAAGMQGCGPTGEKSSAHDGHKHGSHDHHGPKHAEEAEQHEDGGNEHNVITPADYAEAVARIATCCRAIAAAIEKKDPEAAHNPLDEVDIHLQRLMPIVKQNNLPRSQWEQINLTAKKLRLLLNEIHEEIDAGHEPNYTKRSPGITDCLKTLQLAAAPQNSVRTPPSTTATGPAKP